MYTVPRFISYFSLLCSIFYRLFSCLKNFRLSVKMTTDGGRLGGTAQVKWLPPVSFLRPSCKNIELRARLSRRANESKVISEAPVDFGLLTFCVNAEKLSSLSFISPQIKHLPLSYSDFFLLYLTLLFYRFPHLHALDLVRLIYSFVQLTVRSFRKRRSNTRISIWQSTTQSLIKWTSSLTKK